MRYYNQVHLFQNPRISSGEVGSWKGGRALIMTTAACEQFFLLAKKEK